MPFKGMEARCKQIVAVNVYEVTLLCGARGGVHKKKAVF